MGRTKTGTKEGLSEGERQHKLIQAVKVWTRSSLLHDSSAGADGSHKISGTLGAYTLTLVSPLFIDTKEFPFQAEVTTKTGVRVDRFSIYESHPAHKTVKALFKKNEKLYEADKRRYRHSIRRFLRT
jgi:hypothetical protein